MHNPVTVSPTIDEQALKSSIQILEQRILDLTAENERLSQVIFQINQRSTDSKQSQIKEYEAKLLEMIKAMGTNSAVSQQQLR